MRPIEIAGLAAVLLFASALRWTTPDAVEDLRPRPDALEYEEAARRLAHGDGYWLHVGGERYPPRYPPGFSALIVPALLVFGDDLGTGVVAVQMLSAAGIVATWALARAAAGAGPALVAALLLATAPLHVRLSKLVLSEVPSATAVAGVVLLCLHATARSRAGWWVAVGAATGVAATIRLANVLLLVPAALVILSRRRRAGRDRCRDLAALVAGALLGMTALLAYQWHALGSPLATGYRYWLPGGSFFDAANVFGPPVGGGTEGNARFYGAALIGGQSLYGPPVALLSGAGFLLGLRRGGPAATLAVFAGTFVLALWTFYAFFFWQAERFLLPALPLVAAVATLPLARPTAPALRGVAVGLAAIALAGSLRDRQAFATPTGPREVAMLRGIAADTPPNAAILARANAVLFERVVRRDGADRVWIPLDFSEWLFSIRWHGLRSYGRVDDGTWMHETLAGPRAAAAATRKVGALLAAGRPVYVSVFRTGELPDFAPVLAALERAFIVEPAGGRGGAPLLRVLPR